MSYEKEMNVNSRCAKICQKSRNHLKIVGARRLTWGTLHAENSPILGAHLCCSNFPPGICSHPDQRQSCNQTLVRTRLEIHVFRILPSKLKTRIRFRRGQSCVCHNARVAVAFECSFRFDKASLASRSTTNSHCLSGKP